MEILEPLTGPGAVETVQIHLGGIKSDIAFGTRVAYWDVPFDCLLLGVVAGLDPSHEPTFAVVVDCNRVNRSTGVSTSVLSSLPTIPANENRATGVVSGTQAFSTGDLVDFDIDQGDGKGLYVVLTVQRT